MNIFETHAPEALSPETVLLPLPAECARVPGNFWRPNEAFVSELATYLKGRRVLEIFAGNGYLAAQLAARGISVTSTTLFASHDAHNQGLYHPVEFLEAFAAVTRHGESHDVLLVSWPTVTDAVLHAAQAWGPDRDIVFIGEVTDYSKNHLGGCATDEFFECVSFTHTFEAYQGNALEAAHVARLTLPARD
jgi:hypothetical protein